MWDDIIKACIWAFGMTKLEAKEYIANIETDEEENGLLEITEEYKRKNGGKLI